jgi:hypothetical protein
MKTVLFNSITPQMENDPVWFMYELKVRLLTGNYRLAYFMEQMKTVCESITLSFQNLSLSFQNVSNAMKKVSEAFNASE